MAGTFSEYFDGYLWVEFSHGGFDTINMPLTLHGDSIAQTPCDDAFNKGESEILTREDVIVPMYFTSVWGGFNDLMCWLEAIVIGVRECAFSWDPEGPDLELHWERRSRDNGFLTTTWLGKETTKHRVRRLCPAGQLSRQDGDRQGSHRGLPARRVAHHRGLGRKPMQSVPQ
ncbi:MAG: hypothetical protein JSR65_12790 [Proteobacteria bacterium]|nr:hypothetical protein [Pseudomonadota bacterium]